MADPSRPPNFKQYNVKPVCGGCGRKLVAKNESAMWFTGYPQKAVFGYCCWNKGAQP